MEQEKLLLETQLKDQNELLEKTEELEKDNKRLRLLGSLVGCRRQIRTSSARRAIIDHAQDCEEFNPGSGDGWESGSLKCISVPEHERLESVTDPTFLSRSDAGSASEDELNLEYDCDDLGDPLNVTLSLTEERVSGPQINSLIAVKRKDGNMEYCVVMEKKRGDNDTWLYVLKERDSDRQVTVDLDTLDWSLLTEGNGK